MYHLINGGSLSKVDVTLAWVYVRNVTLLSLLYNILSWASTYSSKKMSIEDSYTIVTI